MRLNFILLVALVLSLSTLTAKAAEEPADGASLEDQLKALDVSNQAPSGISKEKFYSVQDRYLPLKHKHEFSVGLGNNLTGNSFLSTNQAEIGYRFHFSNRWDVGVSEAFVSNKFTESANQLQNTTGFIPDVPYARNRADLLATYNVFYGKFRLSSEKVYYFDQYVSVGPGLIQLNTGSVGAAVADLGLALWLGQWGSARLGLKDYYYNEPYRTTTQGSHNIHAHLDIGYLL